MKIKRNDPPQRAVFHAAAAAPVPAEAVPRRGGPLRILGRGLAVLGVVLLSLVILLLGVIVVMCKGPSPTARDLFVTSVTETSAMDFLARICFTQSEVDEILARNAVVAGGSVTQLSGFEQSDKDVPKDTIELVDVSGPTFKGKMLIVHDPSRVKVAAAPEFSSSADGRTVEEFVEEEGAIAGINAGGFVDTGGAGTGGLPIGLVIKDGELLYGDLDSSSSIVGFDQNDVLVVGTLTGQECLDRGIRDAVSFGPAFIVDGQAMEVTGSGGGLNPRTVLGQRADGAVLMLVIDGRQPHSLGATYKDCIDVMLEYGAVNAGNLDGGSSTILLYDGEVRNVCASLYGPRNLPTAFIVK